MRRSVLLVTTLFALVAAVLVGVGCGDDEGSKGSSGGSGAKASLAVAVPGDSLAFGEISLRPSGAVKQNALSVLGKLLDKPSSEVEAYLRKQIAEQDDAAEFAKVEKLIGNKVGFAITEMPLKEGEDPGVVVVAETPDPDGLIASAKKETPKAVDRSYNGINYMVDEDETALGIVDGRAFFGTTEQVFKNAVDKVKGGNTLDKQQRFTETLDKLSGDPLGVVWIDGKKAFEGIAKFANSESDKQALEFYRGQIGGGDLRAAVGLTVPNGTSVALDAAVLGAKQSDGDSEVGDLIEALPGDAWAAFGAANFGKSIEDGLDQLGSLGTDGADVKAEIAKFEQQLGIDLRKDFLSWMGDVALFVRGSDMETIGGALIAKSTDPAKSKQAVTTLGRIAGQAGQQVQKANVSGGEGIKLEQDGIALVVAAKDDRFVVAVSEKAAQDALSGSSKLEDAPGFSAAEDALDDFDPMLFLDFPGAAAVLESFAGDDPDAKEAAKVMKRLSALVIGADSDGDVQRAKVLLTTK